MPITAARRMYSATAVRPIPTDWAITRALAPQAYFRRRTSRTFRIDNLSAGIGPPPAGSQREDLAPFRLPTTEPASPYPQGGRLRSESVAAFARIGWPLSVGISGRLGSDSAAGDGAQDSARWRRGECEPVARCAAQGCAAHCGCFGAPRLELAGRRISAS